MFLPSKIKAKLFSWVLRYLPLEIVGTIFAMLCGLSVYHHTGSPVASAIAGAWGENLGFYGIALIREFLQSARNISRAGYKNPLKSIAQTCQSILIEFGPAEFLDSFLIRPFLMWWMPLLLKNIPFGLFVGKLLADVCFYIPTIIIFELKNRYETLKIR